MHTSRVRLALVAATVGLFFGPAAQAASLPERVAGRILLQVQAHGEAWYVNPTDELRYYLKDGATAYAMLRHFGLGISENDFTALSSGYQSMTDRLKGRILLRVELHGEAYYVDPVDGTPHYLQDGAAAYQIMRTLGLGITNADLLQIWEGTVPNGAFQGTSGVAAPPSTTMGKPTSLRIPVIHVDAVIEAVGLATDGSLGNPTWPMDTAWYESGPRPGDTGSAVIAGHVNWWGGINAVFAQLHALKPGDKVQVVDAQGTVAQFTVRETRTYGAMDSAVDVFRSSDGKSHLNLVTCIGTWDRNAQQFSDRLVVFTDRET